MGEILLEQLRLAKFALEIKQGPQNESLDELWPPCAVLSCVCPRGGCHTYTSSLALNTSRVPLALQVP